MRGENFTGKNRRPARESSNTSKPLVYLLLSQRRLSCLFCRQRAICAGRYSVPSKIIFCLATRLTSGHNSSITSHCVAKSVNFSSMIGIDERYPIVTPVGNDSKSRLCDRSLSKRPKVVNRRQDVSYNEKSARNRGKIFCSTITLNSDGTPRMKNIRRRLSCSANPQEVLTGLLINSTLTGSSACLLTVAQCHHATTLLKVAFHFSQPSFVKCQSFAFCHYRRERT